MNNDNNTAQEATLFRYCAGAFIICLLSGTLFLVAEKSTVFMQFAILAHVLIGVGLSALLSGYVGIHAYRAIKIRKPALLISGSLAALLLIFYVGAALYLAIKGRVENDAFWIQIHRYGGYLLFIGIVAHVAFHYSKKYSRALNARNTHSIDVGFLKFCAAIVGGSLVTVGLTTLLYSAWHEEPVQAVDDYNYTYGSHPFRPSQTETASGSFVHPSQIGNSANCANCHRDIAEQWRSSIHGRAADDPTYVTNVTLLANNKGVEATRYCEGCHAPVALLTGELTEGGEHGGIAGTMANEEGVTCLSCHRMTDVVHLDGVASYVYTPAQGYIFEHSEHWLPSAINDYVTRLSPSHHKQEMAQPLLSQPSQCATCHAQFMDKSMNNWGWVKMQDEYSAWLNSPYSRQDQQHFAASDMVRCQDCHMPLVDANDPSANARGQIRSHRFLAANTMAPFIRGDAEHLELTKQFLQSNKMRLSIEKPHRNDAIQTRLNLNEALRDHDETPYYKYLGETMVLDVVVSNVGVGHDFPGGTADINEAWVELVVKDAAGQLVYTSGMLDEEGYLDQRSHIYQSIPIDKNGNHVWRHDLFNRIGDTYKKVVKAGESDLVQYRFTIPPWAKGPLVANATLKYRKLNTRYAKWALKEKYRPLPIVDMAHDTLLIDLLYQPKLHTE